MDCQDVRSRLLDHRRHRLDADAAAQVAAHLEGCEACRRADAGEAQLSELLERKLPRHRAPAALHERLAARVGEAAAPPAPRRRRWVAPLGSALAAAALVLLAVRLIQPAFLRTPSGGAELLIDEGVNDHLRVLASTHPVDIASGGIHQVKPWLTDRLDFAPRVSFDGDDRFTLEGGSIGYFRDRKAAVYVFKIRLHTVSLFVFRADGLSWPARGRTRMGRLDVDAAVERGFNVLLWRDGGLAYCLVSDVNRADLESLALRIAGP